ncbi:hypothetical protein KCP70_11300 [Salmonella enterica subsp. enterica]|nr:hypothetical protein KCP70_11300 [Salmonella enterica subsp. enterica]
MAGTLSGWRYDTVQCRWHAGAALMVLQRRRAILRSAWRQQQAREADARRTGATGGRVNLRRKTGYGWFARCWRVWRADHRSPGT